ncbi:uncharacterized protein [Parasteatoda tepidariorum]|uniref:uncharacterized protein n=1 Tax=Parasteatoda tepidariorum TaxID=114398 RepID=UPI001C71D34C|nr:uncharacterized protein LOC107444414 [Parasteatoda tepidariorum]
MDNSFTYTLNVLEQKTIRTPIPKLDSREIMKELKGHGIYPSDVTVNETLCLFDRNANEIHGLIGADYAGDLFTGEIKNITNGLVAMNTHFGWTLMGRTGESPITNEVLLSLHVTDLNICDLWSLDSLGITEPNISQTRSEIEEAAKDHFVRSLRRDGEGRYEVSLPWLEVHPELPDNRNLAEKRLKSCVKALQKRNCLHEYENVFRDWVAEKIIEPVDSEELTKDKGHYLPHRPVFKENSTTKIRPVFDASAKERNSVSLNDCVEKGPNNLELIPKLINRFRQGKFGVISDIRRAFQQINVAPSDKKFLRFLWREGIQGN